MDNQVLSRDEAETLGRRMQGLAATQAGLDADFCSLVDQFDAGTGITWFEGIKSTAHCVAWACSMTPGAAREHVRVARALREMPQVRDLFGQGRLSYSKVREITRLVGQVDESDFCELALEMTASQLARTVSAFRTAAGTRIQVENARRYTARPRGDGMVRLSIVLPAEDAAVVSAAVEAAARRSQDATLAALRADPAVDDAATPRALPALDRVQGLVDVAGVFLDSVSSEPVDDHTLVVVHVNAEQLTATADISTAGRPTAERATAQPTTAQPTTAQPTTADVSTADVTTADPITAQAAGENVPAGTSLPSATTRARQALRSNTCHVEGHGPIEPATAQRLVCTATLLGAVVDSSGDVLALGRTVRLATRAQRRALRVRDGSSCQFPGCHQTTHLEAHHLVPWVVGGPTDLDNLILLCRRHHVRCHEGGIRVTRHDGVEDGDRATNATSATAPPAGTSSASDSCSPTANRSPTAGLTMPTIPGT